MHPAIQQYNDSLELAEKGLCDQLAEIIDSQLTAECKIWHGHPVWFIEGNPIVGYSRQKAGIRLMFWSGADFNEESLALRGKKFKDASIVYRHSDEIHPDDVRRWLNKAQDIQWDYKNIVKRKGILMRLK